jgi:hypothetical protein
MRESSHERDDRRQREAMAVTLRHYGWPIQERVRL